jgi:hypothetical protein
MHLTRDEIQDINARVALMKPGFYKAKDIFGDDWGSIKSPTSFGKKFRKSVLLNLISNVNFDRTQTDNHKSYGINLKL